MTKNIINIRKKGYFKSNTKKLSENQRICQFKSKSQHIDRSKNQKIFYFLIFFKL